MARDERGRRGQWGGHPHLIARLEQEPDCAYTKAILPEKEYLNKKSVWVFGGDGWAYDIGFGGLDHVLAPART